jgi:hypothetical protein
MSTFDAANIENTSGGAPNFSQGLTVGGTSITSLINMTEFYDQASEPSSPANGAVWWDGTDMYQYMNSAWRIVSITPPPKWYGERGVYGGGTTNGSGSFNIMEYITISTTGNATDFGDLTVSRFGLTGVSDGSIGLFAGGEASFSVRNTIDYITVATTGNATDHGDLTASRSYLGGCSNGSNGFFGGGATAGGGGFPTNTIDTVAIATPGNATDFGDLTTARYYVASFSDGSRGVWAGGTGSNVIDYVSLASAANAVDFGDTLGTAAVNGGCSSETRGLWIAGNSSIQYVTIATPGNATSFGSLNGNNRGNGGVAGVSNTVRAVFAGEQFNTSTVEVDYVTIDTPGNATDFGDLTQNRYLMAGLSGD